MSGTLTSEAADKVADALFDRKAIKLAGVDGAPAEGFRLKLHDKNPDAPLSPIYLNIREEGHKDGTLLPEDFGLIADLLSRIVSIHELDFRFIAGIPVAGEPIADALFASLRILRPDLVQLHFEKEEDEQSRRIARIKEDLWAGGDVLLVDDLITKAETKLEAIAVCEAAGLSVEGVLVLVDREQGGAEEIAAAGHNLYEAMTLTELLLYYVETGRITQAKADEVEQYIESTAA